MPAGDTRRLRRREGENRAVRGLGSGAEAATLQPTMSNEMPMREQTEEVVMGLIASSRKSRCLYRNAGVNSATGSRRGV